MISYNDLDTACTFQEQVVVVDSYHHEWMFIFPIYFNILILFLAVSYSP